MSSPTVSVAMPARNAEGTLAAAVASLQAQDLEDFEMVLVDHTSTDGTFDAMRSLARSDSRIRVLRCEGSYIDACNLAWRSASGELVARMDADDLATSSRLRRQRDVLVSQPGLVGCGSQVRILKRTDAGELVPPDGGYQRYERWINGVVEPREIERARFIDSPLPHPTMMLRRGILEEMDGYANPPWAEDYDLWLRLVECGHRLGKVPEVLLDWLDGPTRATRSLDRYAGEHFQEAKAHYLARLGSVHEGGVVICGAGPTGKDMATRLRCRGVEIRAFLEVNPRQIGQRIGGVLVLDVNRAGEFLGSATMLAAVGREPGRERLRSLLGKFGFTEGDDFFCIA